MFAWPLEKGRVNSKLLKTKQIYVNMYNVHKAPIMIHYFMMEIKVTWVGDEKYIPEQNKNVTFCIMTYSYK